MLTLILLSPAAALALATAEKSTLIWIGYPSLEPEEVLEHHLPPLSAQSLTLLPCINMAAEWTIIFPARILTDIKFYPMKIFLQIQSYK